MKKQDARKLTAVAQEQLRKQAIRLRLQGKTYQEIAGIVEVSRNTVWKWCRKYKTEGIKSKPWGRPLGARRAMTADQEVELQTLICANTPDQIKLTFALWTRQAVQELIYLSIQHTACHPLCADLSGTVGFHTPEAIETGLGAAVNSGSALAR